MNRGIGSVLIIGYFIERPRGAATECRLRSSRRTGRGKFFCPAASLDEAWSALSRPAWKRHPRSSITCATWKRANELALYSANDGSGVGDVDTVNNRVLSFAAMELEGDRSATTKRGSTGRRTGANHVCSSDEMVAACRPPFANHVAGRRGQGGRRAPDFREPHRTE